jgi:hypothetical protein
MPAITPAVMIEKRIDISCLRIKSRRLLKNLTTIPS